MTTWTVGDVIQTQNTGTTPITAVRHAEGWQAVGPDVRADRDYYRSDEIINAWIAEDFARIVLQAKVGA